MKNLLSKELRLSASPLSWLFLIAGFIALLPGYPILLSAFFVCFGIFHSFQAGRETNDILYSVLLPVPKKDVVRAKYRFTVLIQLIGFALMAMMTLLRMTLLSASDVYRSNALMNASPTYLAFVLLIYTAFNLCFLRGFFQTGYKIGLPFLSFGIATLILIGIGEALHHIPGLEFLHTPGGERLGTQFLAFLCGVLIYTVGTWLSCRSSMTKFELLDL